MESSQAVKRQARLSAVGRELADVHNRIDSVNTKVALVTQRLSPVPDMMSNLEQEVDLKGRKLAELEERNKLHSAKLKLLQNEFKYEKMRADMLMDYAKIKRDALGNGDTYHTNGGQYYGEGDVRGPVTETDAYVDRMGRPPGSPRRSHAGTPRVEAAPPKSPPKSVAQAPPKSLPKADAQTPRQPKYQSDMGPYISIGDADTWKYQVTEAGNQTQDVMNKQNKSDRMLDFEELQKERRRHIYGFHDSTAINPQLWEEKPEHRHYPWFDHETLPYPGGFMFIRFDDAGYDQMNNALKMQQSICRHAGGYLIGIARKEKIYIYEIAQQNKQQNWALSRNQPHRQARATENAVAAFWFTKREAAESYFENGYRNRLREPCFPTPNGYEAYYVPLLSAPPMHPYNTFLFVEFLMHPSKHAEYQERLTQFEAEMRDDMQRLVAGCRPMVVSSQTGRVIFKPGLFVSPYSKLFISRFESQRDVDEIMRIGMIEGLRRKWNLPSEVNVFSMTVEDAF